MDEKVIDIKEKFDNNNNFKTFTNWEKYVYTLCLFFNHLAFVSMS
jgi:hypothetical protein